MKSKWILCAALAAALTAGAALTAFASDAGTAMEAGTAAETEAVSVYSYLSGQQRSSQRHSQFESVAGLATEEERDAFYEAAGLGGGQYSASQHLDTEALVAAGILDQDTAGRIQAYAAGKQEQLHGRYASDLSGMTPGQRHTFYAAYDKDGFEGDCVEELLDAGVITQEQADAIRAYLG